MNTMVRTARRSHVRNSRPHCANGTAGASVLSSCWQCGWAHHSLVQDLGNLQRPTFHAEVVVRTTRHALTSRVLAAPVGTPGPKPFDLPLKPAWEVVTDAVPDQCCTGAI